MAEVAVFVSAGQYPANREDRLALDAFRDLGVSAELVVWDQWDGRAYERGVVKSTWDYSDRKAEYRAWLEKASGCMTLHNPLETMLWSMDKRYLLELASKSVATIPQELVPTNDWGSILQVAQAQGWQDFVAKSVISAGGRQIVRHAASGQVYPEPDVLDPNAPVLVQPFIPEIVDGEYSVICIGGKVSHAVLKVPADQEFRVQDHYGGTVKSVTAPSSVVALAELALARSSMAWTYARVDIVDTLGNGPLLVELELLEPELFLPYSPGSAHEFARAVIEP